MKSIFYQVMIVSAFFFANQLGAQSTAETSPWLKKQFETNWMEKGFEKIEAKISPCEITIDVYGKNATKLFTTVFNPADTKWIGSDWSLYAKDKIVRDLKYDKSGDYYSSYRNFIGVSNKLEGEPDYPQKLAAALNRLATSCK